MGRCCLEGCHKSAIDTGQEGSQEERGWRDEVWEAMAQKWAEAPQKKKKNKMTMMMKHKFNFMYLSVCLCRLKYRAVCLHRYVTQKL
jgi:hypothetical protein